MKFYKTLFISIIMLSLVGASIYGYNHNSKKLNSSETEIATKRDVKKVVTIKEIVAENISSHEEADDYSYNKKVVTEINLNGGSITVSGRGATVSGSNVTIINSGTYRITGSLTNGQVVVNSNDSEKIQLLFNGIDVSCSNNAPIYIKQSYKTIILLEENTTNYISDGTSYTSEEEDANAAIFSKDDLSISGNGILTVTGNYNDGITSKDGLVINSGTIIVNAVDDGIKGKDYLIINDANLTLNVQGDGLKSDSEGTGKGFVTIKDIETTIVAKGDAIQAKTNILISYGEFTLNSGGGHDVTLAQDVSAKGLKSGTNIAIIDGIFKISSADDAIHSNNSLLINGGNFNIASGDDGVHADEVLEINDGNIVIEKSYEGIESTDIIINDGYINLKSLDDGLNAAEGLGESGGNQHPRPRQEHQNEEHFPGNKDGSRPEFKRPHDSIAGHRPRFHGGGRSGHPVGNSHLTVNGGTIIVSAIGDGVDVNGSFDMTGGTIIVNGPTENRNGPLDYDGTFKMTGGFIVAVGSSRMAQAPSLSSTQYAILAKFPSQEAGQMIHVQNNDGTNIFSFVPEKRYQSLAFSSPKLKKGDTYNIYLGGSSTGTSKNGLYLDGTYALGAKTSSFTISSIITNIN